MELQHGRSALKKARTTINILETQVTQLLVDLEVEKQRVAELVSQIEAMAAQELERRNRRERDDFEWYQ